MSHPCCDKSRDLSCPRPALHRAGAEALAREALRRGSLDNVCVMVVALAPDAPDAPDAPASRLEPAHPGPEYSHVPQR